MTPTRHQLVLSAGLALVLLLGWTLYAPALSGPFLFDDFDNLGQLGITPVEDWDSLRTYLGEGHAGPGGRPLSKLSFLIDDHAWPTSPAGFKRTNLLIHLLVGVVLFAAGRLLLRPLLAAGLADWLALGATALWLLHPLQVSTVMYVVQRMTVLSALFVAAGVLSHVWLRLSPRRDIRLQLSLLTLSLGGFGILALWSKESGALLPLYLLVVEATLLSGLPAGHAFIWWRRAFLALPSLALVAYMAYLPNWAPSYANRDFTLAERLITEPVVVMDYLYHLVSLRVSGLGLYQEDFPIYSSLADPSAAAALALLVAALILGLATRRRWPLVSFGILWFMAGHLIESTTVSLELYFEHRNYLPLYGPILATFGLLGLAMGLLPAPTARLLPAVPVLFVALAAANTLGYANEWGDKQRLLTVWALEHPDSPRAQRNLAVVQAEAGHVDAALDTLDAAYARFPTDLSFPLMSIEMACTTGRPRRHELASLSARIEEHAWSDALRQAVRQLAERILDTDCRDQTPALHAFVRRLLDLPKSEVRRSAMASTLQPSGELYLREGNADGALEVFRIVDLLRPKEDTALRIASVYLMAEEYPRALEALEVARERALASAGWRSGQVQRNYAEVIAAIEGRMSPGAPESAVPSDP